MKASCLGGFPSAFSAPTSAARGQSRIEEKAAPSLDTLPRDPRLCPRAAPLLGPICPVVSLSETLTVISASLSPVLTLQFPRLESKAHNTS